MSGPVYLTPRRQREAGIDTRAQEHEIRARSRQRIAGQTDDLSCEVLRRIPVSRSTLHRKVKDGTFPQPRHITRLRIGFFLDEVVDWQRRLSAADLRD